MEATGLVLIMLLAVVTSRYLARITRLPAPFIQIALGAAIYYSSLTSVELDPEVFFLLMLPPLLFLDGWRIPKDDLIREAPTILTLALGLVVFTVLGIGLLIHWLVPAMPLAVAFALAAVISPTDPIAVSAIASGAPIPTRMMRILEGESLFNDATGLVCMRFAVAAALTGDFALGGALASFLWVAIGGLVIGAAVTWLVTRARPTTAALLGDDGGAQILVTLLLPFGVFLLAEHFHCSGILAVVAAGITMGFTPHSHWEAITRIRRTAVWDTVQFAANGTIFVLLGEQLPSILARTPHTVIITGHQNPWWLAMYVGLIVLALAVLRFVWVWLSLQLVFFGVRLRGDRAWSWPKFRTKFRNRTGSWSLPWSGSQARAGARVRSGLPHGRLVLAISLAGVRGVITLAAVLTLPMRLHDGTPLPGRELAIFLAAGVIMLSLLLATVALPHALRGLKLPPEPGRRTAENRIRTAAAQAALAAIESAQQAAVRGDDGKESSVDADQMTEAGRQLVALYQQRIARYGAHDAASPQRSDVDRHERLLRLAGLRAERDEVMRIGTEDGISEITLRKIMREIDLQEARYSS